MKGPEKCFRGKITKKVFLPKPLQFRKFRKKFLNHYHLGTFSEIFPKPPQPSRFGTSHAHGEHRCIPGYLMDIPSMIGVMNKEINLY